MRSRAGHAEGEGRGLKRKSIDENHKGGDNRRQGETSRVPEFSLLKDSGEKSFKDLVEDSVSD